jgi:hypothetical protein
MRTFKKFTLLIAVTALFALSAFSEGNGIQSLYTGTQTVPITASNVTTFVTAKSREFALYTQFNLTGAGSAINRVVLDTSNDNANWQNWGQFNLTANGTTAVSIHTNITAGAYAFWRFTLHNSNSVVATNLIINVYTKPDL